MQLFKSQCLQEQGRESRVLSYREAVFGRRYGGRGMASRTLCQSELIPGDDFTFVRRGEGDAKPQFDRAA